MEVYYQIENETITSILEGEIISGENEVLLEKDINLIENTPWYKDGYTITQFTSPENFTIIKTGLTEKIAEMLRNNGLDIDAQFSLDKYHTYVNDEQHLVLAKQIQYGWNVSEFPIDFEIINSRLSEEVGRPVAAEAKHVNFNNFFMRIVRPGKAKDNNPPHRDVWIDRLRNAVNIYAPICGSSKKSALPLVPGSHLLPESAIQRTTEGAFLNQTQYTVPCVIAINGEQPKLIRPNPAENEMMIFSPYLVHGGGYNLDTELTRVSLEIRFFKKDQ